MGRTVIGAWPSWLGSRLAVSSVPRAWRDAKAAGRCHPRPKSRCSGPVVVEVRCLEPGLPTRGVRSRGVGVGP